MNKSQILFQRASNVIPGGVNSPVRAFRAVKKTPFFVKRAQGAYIFDEDGNRYTDYVCSWGPLILGHAYPQVVEAVQEASLGGLTFGAPTEKEIILAELIKKCVPAMEMTRLVNSGTEAVMSAIRAARGFTGREKIIKFAGCYHGHSDGLLMKGGSGLLTESVPDSAGVPKGYSKYTLLANYNDEKSVENLMSKYGNDVACIIVEPVAANMGVIPPKDGFLEFLRKTSDRYGALLIFDEVITGFRLSLGGAQGYYGVRPDLSAFGKIVGGGMPLAAYGGRKDVMSYVAPSGPVYQAGTLAGNPVAVTAGIETLKILSKRPEIYEQINKSAEKLAAAYIKAGFNINRAASILTPFFINKNVSCYKDALNCDTDKYAHYFNYMLQNGIYVAPSQFEAMFVSYAHTKEIIDNTCSIISKYEI